MDYYPNNYRPGRPFINIAEWEFGGEIIKQLFFAALSVCECVFVVGRADVKVNPAQRWFYGLGDDDVGFFKEK